MEEDYSLYSMFIFFSVVLLTLILLFTNIILDLIFDYIAKRRLFFSTKSVLDTYYETKDYGQCVYETQLIVEKIVYKNKQLSKQYKGLPDIYAGFLQAVNERACNLNEGMDVNIYKKNIVELTQEYKKRNSFEELSGTDSIVFKELFHAMEGSEKEEEGKQLVNELAIQWKKMQEIIYGKGMDKKKQDIITIVGLALTIFFGLIPFIQKYF